MNKAVQGAARLIFFAVLLFFTGCPDLFHDKEPEKPKEYTVTFDAAGGSPETQTRTVREGASLGSSNMPATPGRDGYIFDGWYTDVEGEGSEFSAGTPVSEDITVYARWTAPPGSHTVTFKLNNGTNTNWAARIVISGGTTGAGDFPGDPSRMGYTFAGWNTAAAGSGTPFTASTPVNANITIYAQWTAASPGSYTVAFNLNDGTSTTWAAKTVSSGAAIGTENFPANPSRPGYVFGGWNTQAEGEENVFSASTAVNADITVYAQWTETPAGLQTVIFMLNDGTETIWAAESVTVPGTPVTAFPVPPARLSYIFAGWYTQANGGGSEFTESTAVSGNIIVYAQWTGETYTVTFMSNYAPDMILYTKTVTVPATTILITDFPVDPARTGYNFGSWNTQANGSGSGFAASTAVNASITVYAQWDTYSYTVTFNNDGGDTAAVPAAKIVASPAVNIDALPAPPTRSGYIFAGWYTQADGGSEFTATTTISGNITVYAKWTGETYTVTFMSNYVPDTVLYTKEVTVPATTIPITDFPANPARIGYNFGSWNTQPGGGGSVFTALTEVNASITVYAQWTGETYTVTFKNNYGENETLDTKTVTVPATIIADFPANPSRSSYIFVGWNTRDDGGGTPFTASTAVNGSITVYAQWTGETYTVTFKSNYDANENLYTKTVTVPATTITGFPADPSRNGYSFDSWNTQANGGGTLFTASTTVSDNITVYAQWTNTIITLNPEDAGDGAFSQGTFTLSKDGDESQTVTITGSGYTNPRWFVDGDLKGTGTGITIQAADYGAGGHKLTLLISKSGVSWSKAISFTVEAGALRTVIFRTNDGTGAVYATRTVTTGNALDSSFPADPGRDGYDFSGWNTQAGGGGSAFDSTSTISADTTIYAKWTGKTYTVTFMRNYAPDTVLYTRTVTVPATTITGFPADPSRTGAYNFAGWYSQADGGGTVFTASTAVTSNMTVYAGWSHTQFGITLNLDAGDGAFSQGTFTLSKNGDESQTVTITGSGYTNPRWFVDGDLKGTGTGITIQAADYGAGGHKLTLLISKSGVSWSKAISFTVTN